MELESESSVGVRKNRKETTVLESNSDVEVERVKHRSWKRSVKNWKAGVGVGSGSRITARTGLGKLFWIAI